LKVLTEEIKKVGPFQAVGTSFIGWGGVSLKRDLGESELNLTPSELFTFRPDLLINAPKEFLFTPFVFQEVAP